jgi:hypothetical protein
MGRLIKVCDIIVKNIITNVFRGHNQKNIIVKYKSILFYKIKQMNITDVTNVVSFMIIFNLLL